MPVFLNASFLKGTLNILHHISLSSSFRIEGKAVAMANANICNIMVVLHCFTLMLLKRPK